VISPLVAQTISGLEVVVMDDVTTEGDWRRTDEHAREMLERWKS